MAGVDRRRRPAVGPADQSDLRLVRSLKDLVLLSRPQIQPRQSLGLFGAGQRAVLYQTHRPRSEALWAVARSAQRQLSAGPVRQCPEISGGGGRRARQEHPRRLLLRRADRDRRIAAVPQPGLRRGGRQALGPAAVLQRPRLLPVEGSGAALPGRHVVRLLPCQRQPRKAAGQPGRAAMGQSELDRRRPVFLGRPHPGMERRHVEFPVSGIAHGAAGIARHLAGVDRQHQQPAHNERDLRSVAAAAERQTLGARDAWAPTISPTSSSTTSSRAAR